MTDTFRALCAELITSWDADGCDWKPHHQARWEATVARARAALAEAEETAAPAPPADGEVAELAAWLRETGDTIQPSHLAEHQRYKRAAELLQRQVLVPVPVGVRPWEREGWCDPNGLCWLGSNALDGCTPTWFYGPPAWAERFPNFYRVLLPAHSLPLPESE